MPIGTQEFDGVKVTAAELKQRYTDLIREALLKANPKLDTVRADEVSIPGTITTDILTRLMHSDIVVADVTYPNPNVFYELGLRHAAKSGTIILRDASGPRPPFDIAHLRHIQYDNTPSGLKQLSEDIRPYLEHFRKNPGIPDNQFLEMAKLTQFQYPSYNGEPEPNLETEVFTNLIQNPEILDLLVRQTSGEEIDQNDMTRAMLSNPDTATMLARYLTETGQLSLTTTDAEPPKKKPSNRSRRTSPKQRSKRKRK